MRGPNSCINRDFRLNLPKVFTFGRFAYKQIEKNNATTVCQCSSSVPKVVFNDWATCYLKTFYYEQAINKLNKLTLNSMHNKQIHNLRSALGAFALLSLTFGACDKGGNTAEEVITTIEVHVTGAGGFDRKFYWNDTDGDGLANSIDSVELPANTANLQCHLHVYDRSQTPELNITEEIEAESTEHLFVYAVSGGASLSISGLDADTDGKPFGLTSVWATALASTGGLNIKLYHEPTDKTSTTNSGGSVDFDVVFPVKIE